MAGQNPTINPEIENAISSVTALDISDSCRTVERPLAGLRLYPEALKASDLAFLDKLASKVSTAKTLYSEYGSDWLRTPHARPLTDSETSVLAVFFLVFADPKMLPADDIGTDLAFKFLNAGLRILDLKPEKSLAGLADDRLSWVTAR